ncbi:tRNA (adenosine(37)-N6)-threonylcarbamoyltransferase complex transferase subunit TsaD [Candidatus Peregrinibacteria bacterium]|nr:tRNA (adenosine(37)-N6)-threonylcarbamoyltransferase complex transferase subunit TsaD [Candidatus Peregrinibacteria bacterium]
MKILGIETSCDETSCSVVENGWKVLSNVIASQVNIHEKTGGVVPEVAAREHVLKIVPVLDECMALANCKWHDIDAVAVTKGPGLVSSLIIGTETASVISYVKEKPLVPVQHIAGHIYSNWLEVEEEIKFPILILTVSGGHNELILALGHNKFKVLGETLDDAAGEAFDKVARILGLGYPGGPVISKIAEKGNKNIFDLPRSYLEKGSFDFSFSGLKTAVLNEVKEYIKNNKLDDQFKADLAADFQEAVCDVLSEKLIWAYEKFPEIKEIHLAGGVSANLRLREIIQKKLSGKIKFRFPKSLLYCTDNAAMVASAGYYIFKGAENKYLPGTNIVPTTSFEIW